MNNLNTTRARLALWPLWYWCLLLTCLLLYALGKPGIYRNSQMESLVLKIQALEKKIEIMETNIKLLKESSCNCVRDFPATSGDFPARSPDFSASLQDFLANLSHYTAKSREGYRTILTKMKTFTCDPVDLVKNIYYLVLMPEELPFPIDLNKVTIHECNQLPLGFKRVPNMPYFLEVDKEYILASVRDTESTIQHRFVLTSRK